MFKIDVSHRIVRTTTALEFIDRTYKEQLDKYTFPKLFKAQEQGGHSSLRFLPDGTTDGPRQLRLLPHLLG